MEPIHVAGGAFLNQACPQSHTIYTVPDGKLLIIEDASAGAFDSATASSFSNPGIVANACAHLGLSTVAGADASHVGHTIVARVGLPVVGGRTMRVYAAPGTEVRFTIEGCKIPLNVDVSFSGQLVDFP